MRTFDHKRWQRHARQRIPLLLRVAFLVCSAIVLLSEPLSPELVLVDPELARRERARLTEMALQQALLDIAALHRRFSREADAVAAELDRPRSEPVSRPRKSAARRLLPAALVSLVLIALVPFVGGSRGRSAISAPPSASRPSSGVLAARTARADGSTLRGPLVAAARSLPRRLVIENRIASLILAAPAEKLPRSFVDPRTGRAHASVTVACRACSGLFRCVACVLGGAGVGGIVVAFRPRPGGGVFAWYGYRRLPGG